MKKHSSRLLPHLSAVLVLSLLATGCVQTVPFYKRKSFADPVKDLASDPLESMAVDRDGEIHLSSGLDTELLESGR